MTPDGVWFSTVLIAKPDAGCFEIGYVQGKHSNVACLLTSCDKIYAR